MVGHGRSLPPLATSVGKGCCLQLDTRIGCLCSVILPPDADVIQGEVAATRILIGPSSSPLLTSPFRCRRRTLQLVHSEKPCPLLLFFGEANTGTTLPCLPPSAGKGCCILEGRQIAAA